MNTHNFLLQAAFDADPFALRILGSMLVPRGVGSCLGALASRWQRNWCRGPGKDNWFSNYRVARLSAWTGHRCRTRPPPLRQQLGRGRS